MKIAGQEISGPNETFIVLPRGEGEIVLHIRAVMDFDEFNAKVSPPLPKARLGKGGVKSFDYEEPNYKSEMASFQEKQMSYILLKSLEPSEIEWDTVDMDKPDTWKNAAKDFQAAGFSVIEIGRIVEKVKEANCLNEEKLEQARQVFLHGQKAPQGE